MHTSSIIIFHIYVCINLQGLPIIKSFVAGRKGDDDCSCEQPLYEDESETETVVARASARQPVSHVTVM